ncbi:MAG: calcium-binding protein, partial [Tepidiformaceae bacterium]
MMGSLQARRVLLAAGLALARVQPATGQTLTRDPATGHYVLTYTDQNGSTHTVLVEARDRARPDLAAQVTSAGGQFVYQYTLANRPGAPQPIMALDVPCPSGDAGLTVASPATWNAKVVTHGDPPVILACEFAFRQALLAPGATVSGLLVRTSFLPAIAEARVFGSVQNIGLPTAVEDTPDTVYRLVQLVQGFGFFDGGGLRHAALVPGRPPSALTPPSAGLDSVASDMSQSCTLGWIASPGACTDLGGRLDQARQSLSQGDSAGAQAQLQSFLAELSAQHGPDLSVNDNAFWLLKINTDFILARLGGAPSAPVCFGTLATIYVQGGVIVGGPKDGQPYAGQLDGTSGNDVIVGTDARDIVEAGAGADKICGGGGDDLLKGQGDADQLEAGDGNDTVEGGTGNDVILGGAGNDLLKAQDGNDLVDAGEGNDTVEGGPGDDDLDGGPGTDMLKGQTGIDRCRNGETLEGCE